MSTDPSYLRTAQDGLVRNLRDWGIPLGRRFRALKLWFLIREHGVEGLQARVRRDVANARGWRSRSDAAPEWERLAPAPLQTVCVRHVPAALRDDEDALAVHNLGDRRQGQQARPLLPHALAFSRDGRCSASPSAPTTEREHVQLVWDELRGAPRD